MLGDPPLARLWIGGAMSRGWRLAVEGNCLFGKGGGGVEGEPGVGRIGSAGLEEDELWPSSAGRDGNGLC